MLLLASRSRAATMAGSRWPSTSAIGCGRTRTPAPSGCSATPTPAARARAQMIPGWPYSFVAALEPGRTSWTALLDVLRVRPCDDHTDLAATQLRTLIETLVAAGHSHEGDPTTWIIGDSGYDRPRLALPLADPPRQILAGLRSDRSS